MKQQTAIKFLKSYIHITPKLFEKAKQIEKEQIVDAIDKYLDWSTDKGNETFDTAKEAIEQFYKETYGK
jgi:hypothetical protein